MKTGTQSGYVLPPISGPSIVLAMNGSCDVIYGEKNEKSIALSRGTILFIASDTEISFSNMSNGDDLLLFQAYCDLE